MFLQRISAYCIRHLTSIFIYHSTDAHLIAWFSAGAFVILGFPISMFGIVSHLANYNQPHVQVYVVRILWMVPIYSIESWLAMRFHDHAIYIETLRDLYESYVLYSFTQFLIQVLGGEESLILMLKDKSPTRGVHMWGLQWCVKPWLMGQPVRKTVYERDDESGHKRAMKRVHWKSPFFINCKFGVLQYVLLKFLSAVAVLLLEWKGLYKEGNFTYKGGYLYICILTNLSQCWALYCLIFFYYATKTELSPIRPVGKFLSVKALVFFTWWQSVAISILYQMDLIPEYRYAENDWSPEDVAKFLQDYLICIEMFLAAVVHTFVFPHSEYSPQAVEARTRALNQMPMKHRRRLGRTKYTPTFPYYKDDSSKCSTTGEMELATFDSGNSVHSAETWDDQPLATPSPFRQATHSRANSLDTDDSMLSPSWEMAAEDAIMRAPEAIAEGEEGEETERHDDSSDRDYSDNDDGDDDYEEYEEEDVEAMSDVPSVTSSQKPGFVRALLDSAIPLDLRENTVGIVRGDYHVERKTLLQHATTSDQYDLFAHRRPFKRKEPQSP